jgi:hypothetical protein
MDRESAFDRFFLRDDGRVKLVFHSKESRRLRFLKTRHRNSRPSTDDKGNLLFA